VLPAVGDRLYPYLGFALLSLSIQNCSLSKILSKSRKGIKFSDEHRLHLRISQLGKKQPQSQIDKRSKKNTGKTRTPEVIERLRKCRAVNIEKTNKTIRLKGSKKNSASPYKGVYKHRDKWQSKITLENKKTKALGRYDTQEKAAKAYDFHALQIYGRGNCYLNFPNLDYSNFQIKPQKKQPKNKYSPNKLSKEKAREIREKHKNDSSMNELAKEYNVNATSISKVINNITYKESKETAIVNVIHNP